MRTERELVDELNRLRSGLGHAKDGVEFVEMLGSIRVLAWVLQHPGERGAYEENPRGVRT